MRISFSLMVYPLIFAACTSVPAATLGVRNGKLAPCPSSPNCVSSGSVDREHAVAPLFFHSTVPEAKLRMKRIIAGMKRAHIADEKDSYIRAEFTSAVWRFVDDVEFYFDDATKTVQLRSASRLGHSDFGVNRKRVEEIRSLWNADRG